MQALAEKLVEAVERSGCVSFRHGDQILCFIDQSVIDRESLESLTDGGMPMASSLEFIMVVVPSGKTVRDCVFFARREAE